ncbi:HAD family hydrolase [Rhizobium sp. WSM1325]|uniref:phosphoglycolate phosphatase n=1 Tax=Rhizobium leguminosarum TaxID=384 RepID=A0A154I7S8_RHILE|nr:hypothetical protein A4A59_05210 [Rhizobium leguminosarum]RWY66198.1 HAD family hydrolase [Rhizobium leguminosarum]
MLQYETLITDFDNTLYDWVDVWSTSFLAMLGEMEPIAQVPRDELLRAIRSVHQKHGTSEYAFLLQEIGANRLFPDEEREKALHYAALGYQRGRASSLKLYPGVREALLKLRSKGIPIIIYTESLEIYTNGRIIDLDLDGIIDVVYSPPNHDLQAQQNEQISLLGEGRRSLKATKHRYLPAGVTKPNPEVLRDIIAEIGANPATTMYVGDSPMKDVAMAQEVGVLDVLARYGQAQHRPEYEILRMVSHWPDVDVEKERHNLQRPVEASVIIDSFEEVVRYFT